MQSQYQQLSYPQASVAFLVAPGGGVQDAAEEPNCCQCSQCCAPPNCCSRVGSCPCFCSGPVAGFSIALVHLWLALPVLVTAIAIPDFFDIYNGYSWQYGFSANIGAFSSCLWYNSWYSTDCSDGDLQLGNGAMFDAFRSFLIIGVFFLLVSAILASIRLARQQRSKLPGACMEWTTAMSTLTAFTTTSIAFVLSNTYLGTMNSYNGGGMYGLSWVMLTVAEGLIAVGTLTHLITWRVWVRKTARAAAGGSDEEQPGAMYGQQAAFSHPAPLYYTAAAPPPAAVMQQPTVMYPTAVSFPAMTRPPMPVHIYRN
jgi:hypothetical protein